MNHIQTREELLQFGTAIESGSEDVSLLERCPHFRGCYVQASMVLEPEDVPNMSVSS